MKVVKINAYLNTLIILGILYFLLGFALGINGLLIPYLKKAFHLSNTDSYLVLTATFSAFILFGYPFGLLIQKIGYRKGMLASFVLFAIGLYLFVPSAKTESFILFLTASFISGMGNALLQAVVGAYVTICGPTESALKRFSVLSIINKLGWAIAPVFLAIFLDLKQVSIQLSDMYLPFYIIAGIFILMGIIIWLSPLPEIKAKGEEKKEEYLSDESAAIKNFVAGKKNIFQFPHLVFGALALFFHMSVEIIALASVVDFAHTLGLKNPELYQSLTVGWLIFGCLIGTFLVPGIISQLTALRLCTFLGMLFSLVAVLLPINWAIYGVTLIGLSSSLIWSAIFPLSLAYLGKFTKLGSSILVMAVVGGAVGPLIFGWLKDVFGDMQQAYWICFPSYIFILFYAYWGYKSGLKKINPAL
jgi:MFS transporter, FHS family, L-fucose permease